MNIGKKQLLGFLFLLLGAFGASLYADAGYTETEAFNSLEKGNYNEAIIAYENLLSQSGDKPEVLFNLGIAYYRTLRFSSAESSFEKALQLKIEDPVFQSHAEYNIGNALFQQARLFWRDNPQRALFYLKESITAFENAVELQSDFQVAQSNLSAAKALLARLQQKHNESQDEDTEAPDSTPSQEEQSGDQQEEGTSTDQTETTQQSSGNPGQQTGNPDAEPSGTSENGGGEQGELMDVNEAMMLLDSVEMDEKRITLSKLLEEKPSTQPDQPDW